MPGFEYPEDSLVTPIDADSFEEFIKTHNRAFIHFGAAWNGYDKMLMSAVVPAAKRLQGKVQFAVVDVDLVQNHHLCQEHHLHNVPYVEYYVNRKLLNAFVGYDSKVKHVAGKYHPTTTLLKQLIDEFEPNSTAS